MPGGLSASSICCAAVYGWVDAQNRRGLPADPQDPWTPEQTVGPADFAKELQQEKDPRPTVIYVGVKTLYEGGHIPGAVFFGAGSTAISMNVAGNITGTNYANVSAGVYTKNVAVVVAP